MSGRKIQIAGLDIAPGTTRRCGLDLIELPDGLNVKIPVLIINGAQSGPAIFLGAAIHGDEANGIEIMSKALRGVAPESLSGTIICVPVQNPLAFHADQRIALGLYVKSPLDQAPADPWTVFPGIPDGNFAQMLAHKIFQLIRQCDYAIDCHTPTRGGRYPPIAILPHPSLSEAAKQSLDLAKAFGAPYIMQPSTGFYIAPGIQCVEAARIGIPSFTFEVGEGGRLESSMVDEGVRCVRNVLCHLKMIDGPIVPPKQCVIMSDFIGLRAKRGGLLHTEVELGARVRRGDILARIFDIYGDEVENAVAPQDGIFIRATTLAAVSTGDRVATIGI